MDHDKLPPHIPPYYQSAFKAVKTIYSQDLGGSLKEKEAVMDPAVPLSSPYVIRLDGVSFSTFTHGLQKPFDARLKNAMVEVAKDLFVKFTPVMAYHQSDEISLVFPPALPTLAEERDEYGRPVPIPAPKDDDSEIGRNEEATTATSELSAPEDSDEKTKKKGKKTSHEVSRTHMYNGRAQKLASVTASYASVRLAYHLSKQDWTGLSEKTQARMTAFEACFDARVVPLHTWANTANCIYWRSNFDGFRNAISMIAQSKFSHKRLQGLNLAKLVELLKEEAGTDIWSEYGKEYLFGTWIKKETYEMVGYVVPKTGVKLDTPVVRRRLRTGSFNWAQYDEESRIRFVAAKNWPMDGPPADPLPTDSLLTEHDENEDE